MATKKTKWPRTNWASKRVAHEPIGNVHFFYTVYAWRSLVGLCVKCALLREQSHHEVDLVEKTMNEAHVV